MGLGYIGLPTAAFAASKGLTILGVVDINLNVVEPVNRGEIHTVEPFLGDLVKKVIRLGHFWTSDRPQTTDAYFIVVQTLDRPIM